MNRTSLIAGCALAAVLLAGCHRDAQESASSSANPPQAAAPQAMDPAGGGRSAAGAPAPDTGPVASDSAGGGQVSRPPSPPRVNRDGVAQQPTYKISGAGEDGWSKAELSASELGAKLDEAIATLKDATADASISIENEELKGQLQLNIDVANPETYKIEYVLVTRPEETQVAVANGKKRSRLESSVWSAPKPVASAGEAIDGRKLLSTWADQFPSHAMRSLTDRQPTWRPLLEALERGELGFRMVVETKTMPVGGQPRPFFRVLAERPGTEQLRFEMRFDGTRFVPLTLRANRDRGPGASSKAQWTAGWKFGQKVDTREFEVPGEPNPRG